MAMVLRHLLTCGAPCVQSETLACVESISSKIIPMYSSITPACEVAVVLRRMCTAWCVTRKKTGTSWTKIARESCASWTKRRLRWKGITERSSSCLIQYSRKTKAKRPSSRTPGTLSSPPLTGETCMQHEQRDVAGMIRIFYPLRSTLMLSGTNHLKLV